jgi:hypothetical protein
VVVVVALVILVLASAITEAPAEEEEFQAVLPVVFQGEVWGSLDLLAKDLMVAIKEAAAQRRQLAAAEASANKELMEPTQEI